MTKKILFINQEMTPYVPETEMSLMGRNLPQAMQENDCEIRTFMPKWGNINERRGQLHEVIRLSWRARYFLCTWRSRNSEEAALGTRHHSLPRMDGSRNPVICKDSL